MFNCMKCMLLAMCVDALMMLVAFSFCNEAMIGDEWVGSFPCPADATVPYVGHPENVPLE